MLLQPRVHIFILNVREQLNVLLMLLKFFLKSDLLKGQVSVFPLLKLLSLVFSQTVVI